MFDNRLYKTTMLPAVHWVVYKPLTNCVQAVANKTTTRLHTFCAYFVRVFLHKVLRKKSSYYSAFYTLSTLPTKTTKLNKLIIGVL
jgi:hypothetical protein